MSNSKLLPQTLTIKEKISVLEAAENERAQLVMDRFKLKKSTYYDILNSKDKILKAYDKGLEEGRKRLKLAKYYELEQEIFNWIKREYDSGKWITGRIIRDKAKQFAMDYNRVGFKASNGWLDKFKKRFHIDLHRPNSLKSKEKLKRRGRPPIKREASIDEEATTSQIQKKIKLESSNNSITQQKPTHIEHPTSIEASNSRQIDQSTTQPRGRGRPPKNNATNELPKTTNNIFKPETDQPLFSESLTFQNDITQTTNQNVKRRRGRPPKQSAVNEVTSQNLFKESTQINESPERIKEDEIANDSTIQASIFQIKRPIGRPPKQTENNPIDISTKNSIEKDNQIDENPTKSKEEPSNSKTQVSNQEVKRPKGRPPKRSNEENIDESSKHTEVKKEFENSTTILLQQIEENPTTNQSSTLQVKKSRGRPPKSTKQLSESPLKRLSDPIEKEFYEKINRSLKAPLQDEQISSSLSQQDRSRSQSVIKKSRGRPVKLAKHIEKFFETKKSVIQQDEVNPVPIQKAKRGRPKLKQQIQKSSREVPFIFSSDNEEQEISTKRPIEDFDQTEKIVKKRGRPLKIKNESKLEEKMNDEMEKKADDQSIEQISSQTESPTKSNEAVEKKVAKRGRPPKTLVAKSNIKSQANDQAIEVKPESQSNNSLNEESLPQNDSMNQSDNHIDPSTSTTNQPDNQPIQNSLPKPKGRPRKIQVEEKRKEEMIVVESTIIKESNEKGIESVMSEEELKISEEVSTTESSEKEDWKQLALMDLMRRFLPDHCD